MNKESYNRKVWRIRIRVVLKRMPKLKSGLSSGASRSNVFEKMISNKYLGNPTLLTTATCGLNIVLCKYRWSMHVNRDCSRVLQILNQIKSSNLVNIKS